VKNNLPPSLPFSPCTAANGKVALVIKSHLLSATRCITMFVRIQANVLTSAQLKVCRRRFSVNWFFIAPYLILSPLLFFSCIRLWQAVFSPWFVEHAYQDAFKRKTLCLPSSRLQKSIFPFSILKETWTRSRTTGFNHRFTWSLPSLLWSLSRQQNHHAWYASSQLFNGSDA
jgi:hypothetical protein